MNVVRILYVEAVLTALALCVVWQAAEVRKAGYRLEALRRERERRTAELQSYRAHVGKLKSPQRILHLVETLGLRLTEPVAGPNAIPGLEREPEALVQTAQGTPHDGTH